MNLYIGTMNLYIGLLRWIYSDERNASVSFIENTKLL